MAVRGLLRIPAPPCTPHSPHPALKERRRVTPYSLAELILSPWIMALSQTPSGQSRSTITPRPSHSNTNRCDASFFFHPHKTKWLSTDAHCAGWKKRLVKISAFVVDRLPEWTGLLSSSRLPVLALQVCSLFLNYALLWRCRDQRDGGSCRWEGL